MISFKRIIVKIIILLVGIFTITTIGGVILYSRYPLDYKQYIDKYSGENGIDPYLVASIINVESGFDKNAISHKDARGLMQIAEKTGQWGAEELEIKNYKNNSLFDAELNIKIGTWYIKKLEKEFNGKADLILAAYNGGSGNVNKWLEDKKYSKDGKSLEKIPFKETENYLKRVKSNYKTYKRIYKDVDFKNEEYDSMYINFLYKIKDYIRSI
ncbi:MAG: lytic transglycosylase domain-containing protein [Tissierella sp.]|uniref:lytic transglycosylase domain-containing protein n=1 Tax=Tissierella sp. TaxID=41274 RepID=UPI003F96DE47